MPSATTMHPAYAAMEQAPGSGRYFDRDEHGHHMTRAQHARSMKDALMPRVQEELAREVAA